ncbi:HAMP domain-containing sensor histidine kinase [Nocardia pseudovaccinii]|uniref:sensor histidine kinase n=1 Tax=Nocardia pseudovaccinii TaxID=189540 RepID=UPI003D942093
MVDDGGVDRFARWMAPSRWGLRIRSAIAAALMVGLVLGVAAAVMAWLLHRSLVGDLDTAAATRVGEVSAELMRMPVGELPDALFDTDGRVAGVQVIDPHGRVVRASSGKLATPLTELPVADTRAAGLRAARRYDEDLRVAAGTVSIGAGTYTVLVAADTESVERTVAVLAVLLAVGGPVVVAAAAAATYLLVGRSLRSVDEIRARVAGIESTDLSRRVPVPVARDEIAQLAETMNDMLARVEAGHLAQKRFVGDASHELRSPLATVTAALELARDRPEVLDRELITVTLLPEAGRMLHLIEDLLTLAAADEHGLELRTSDVDLDDLAAELSATLRLRGTLTVSTRIHAVRVVGDRARLQRALRNIVDNAAAHARSRIAICTEERDGRAVVVVDDDGPGIPAADRDRVFGRFVRLDADRARCTGGSGLGLAIVAEIVAAHGGSVTVSESVWGGARFVVDLPRGGIDEPIPDSA